MKPMAVIVMNHGANVVLVACNSREIAEVWIEKSKEKCEGMSDRVLAMLTYQVLKEADIVETELIETLDEVDP